jgi:hypothetical protein
MGSKLGLSLWERSIFGPKRDEDGSWRILHNDELHGSYFLPNIVRVIINQRA